MSINKVVFNPFNTVVFSGFQTHRELKNTKMKLQTLQNNGTFLLLQNNISGGISSVMGGGYVENDENKKIFYRNAKNLYRRSMMTKQKSKFDFTG